MAFALLMSAALAASPAPPQDRVAVAEAAPAAPSIMPSPDAEILQTDSDFYQRMTIPVMIGGQGPFDFMIDTGAQATVITRTVGERLGLKATGRAILVGMASRLPVELVQLNGLEFAARVLDNLRALVLEERHVGADGILGLDSLQDMRVVMNFRDQTIAVDNAVALGGNAGYEIIVRARRMLGRLIITEATIDGVRTSVIVDTGAQSSIGNLSLQKKLRARDREKSHATDVHGQTLDGTIDYARSLRLRDMELNNLSIMFADSPAFAALGLDDRPALVLGMRELRVFDRVAIDFATRSVLFDMPSNRRSRPPIDFGSRPSRL